MEVETRIGGVPVEQGTAIDFVVDCRGDSDKDAFTWAPSVQLLKFPDEVQFSKPPVPADGGKWNAHDDFRGPAPPGRLSVWEEYAQSLLLADEFVFID